MTSRFTLLNPLLATRGASFPLIHHTTLYDCSEALVKAGNQEPSEKRELNVEIKEKIKKFHSIESVGRNE